MKIQVTLTPGAKLSLAAPGQPVVPLIQLKGLVFRAPQFSDTTLEFVAQNGQVTGLKCKDPEGEFTLPKE